MGSTDGSRVLVDSADLSGNLRSRTISGGGWSVLFRASEEIFGFAAGIAFARLLAPSDFGMVAMVSLLMGFAHLLREFGLRTSLVQRAKVLEADLSTIFWYWLFAGTLLMILFMLASGLIADLFHQARLAPLAIVMSVGFIVSVPLATYQTILTLEMRFLKLGSLQLAARVVGTTVGLAMAVNHGGVWALVVAAMCTELANLAFLALSTRWPVGKGFSFGRLRSLMWFGGHYTLTHVLTYVSQSGDKFLIGRMLGETPLGLYRRAWMMMTMPWQSLTLSLWSALYRALSVMKDEEGRSQLAYLRICRWVQFVTLPLTLGMGAVAEPFTIGLYGEQWAGMVPVLRYLCVVGAIRCPISLAQLLYTSQGRPDLGLRMSVIDGAMTLVLSYLGLRLGGVMGLVYANVAWNCIWLVPALGVPLSLIGLRFMHQLRDSAGILAAAVLMVLVVLLVSESTLISNRHCLSQLFMLSALGGVAYLMFAACLRLSVLQELRAELSVRGWKIFNRIFR